MNVCGRVGSLAAAQDGDIKAFVSADGGLFSGFWTAEIGRGSQEMAGLWPGRPVASRTVGRWVVAETDRGALSLQLRTAEGRTPRLFVSDSGDLWRSLSLTLPFFFPRGAPSPLVAAASTAGGPRASCTGWDARSDPCRTAAVTTTGCGWCR